MTPAYHTVEPRYRPLSVFIDARKQFRLLTIIPPLFSIQFPHKPQSLYTCNQFNATLVDCNLGNPMRRNAEAKLSLRFDPQRVDDLVSRLSFQVFVNTTSTLLEGTRQSATLAVNVIKRAKISISGWVLKRYLV